uniref:SCP domain-containing protein n=1 Tax=Anas platyrhynchos platyrhynchos TaxID=8840 RepID=A0A493T1K7_ANAPP
MGPGLWAAVLALGLGLEAVWAQPIFPSITNRPFIRECVRVHNEFRRQVVPSASNMRQMSWDAALARTARAWANKCVFKSNTYLSKRYQCHPTFEFVGENIWIGSYQIFDVQTAVSTWYKNNIFYNFSLHTCIKNCDRYIQVVWATSYKVGCAVHFCHTVENFQGLDRAAHFVCNYGPAGNYPTKPYEEGPPCSRCSNDKCVDKLCVNAGREKLISYDNWYPDWDTQPRPPPRPRPSGPPADTPPAGQPRSSCDSYCLSVLILRLLFLVLSAAGIDCWRHHVDNTLLYIPTSLLETWSITKTCLKGHSGSKRSNNSFPLTLNYPNHNLS